ncbi:hypothetical protein [Thermofilum pendens]|nr:hypothetical protein [Thermofilum pendens]
MPRIIFTTSRHDTVPLRRLARELATMLYSAARLNRGGRSLPEVLALARARKASRLVVIYRGRGGNPGRMVFFDLSGDAPRVFPYLIRLRGVVFSPGSAASRRPAREVPVVSLGSETELAEELSVMLDVTYLGAMGEEAVAKYPGRLMVVEKVDRPSLAYVIKFYEGGSAIGPKLLIESLVRIRSRSLEGIA